MNDEDRKDVEDIARIHIHEYFDHYLCEIFPQQLDRSFAAHNSDIQAHPVQMKELFKTKKKVDRLAWMGAGIVAFITAVVTVGPTLYHWLVDRTPPTP
jgi:hypothetical protein